MNGLIAGVRKVGSQWQGYVREYQSDSDLVSGKMFARRWMASADAERLQRSAEQNQRMEER